jgi:hypothetical protein
MAATPQAAILLVINPDTGRGPSAAGSIILLFMNEKDFSMTSPRKFAFQIPDEYGDMEDFEIEVTNCRDALDVEKLLALFQQGDKSATRHLASIIRNYEPFTAARLYGFIDDCGVSDEIIGDWCLEQSEELPGRLNGAKMCYENSAIWDHPCGMCKYGRCLAEGSGCEKNPASAKLWLEKAANLCPEAGKYLDQYGLR